MRPTALVLFILLSLHMLVSSHVTYHIKPTLQSLCDFESCHTLQEIVNDTNRDRYFTTNITNVTLVFLPGVHVLDTELVLLKQLESLTFLGDSTSAPNITSTVMCNGSSAFIFKHISDLEIKKVAFTKCGSTNPIHFSYTIHARKNYNHIYLPSLTMSSVTSCSISNCKMEHNYLALLTNESLVHIHNTIFVGNSGEEGGAVQVIGGLVVFTGSNWFLNNSADSGGGVYVVGAQLYLKGSVQFHTNNATVGGAIRSVDRSKIYFDEQISDTVQTINTSFVGNSAQYGGSISLLHSFITQHSGHTVVFRNNAATDKGGAIESFFGNFMWKGELVFQKNIVVLGDGGAVYLYFCQWKSMGATAFTRNTANDGQGGAIFTYYIGVMSFLGTTSFTKNNAMTGGGICATGNWDIEFNTTAELTFSGNSAELSGGWLAMWTRHISISARTITLSNNRAGIKGGAISIFGDNSNMTIGKECQLQNNSATLGGAIAIEDGSIILRGTYSYQNNSAKHGAAIFASNGYMYLQGKHTFTKNNARHNEYTGYGGGIYALKTGIVIEGEANFTGNSASYGGGLAYADYSHAESRLLYLRANTIIHFLNNHAYTRGGGILVEEASFLYCSLHSRATLSYKSPCFFQVDGRSCTPQQMSTLTNEFGNDTTHVIFKANTAAKGGNDIYGGILDKCGVCIPPSFYMLGSNALKQLVGKSIEQIPGKHSDITSNPFQLCHCEGLQPNCNNSQINTTLCPGETIQITAVAIGQMNGTSPAVVHAAFENPDEGSLNILQSTQSVNRLCTSLEYTVHKKSTSNAKLKLYIEQQCGEIGYAISTLVKFLPCPSGFTLSRTRICICDYRLQKYTNSCNINRRTITRSTDFWVGYDNQSHGLILHPHCPFDYCTLETVSFTLNSTDQQCAHGRLGILCGACESGLSLNLGSSRCSSCSNTFVLLLLPFAAAGFLLVIFLFTCKLTVSAGTTSGLIFYANVIAVNRSVFFPPGETNILTVFIAWLNLDLGIETCFFDGMDAYTRTWLQFVFPLYIWSLVGLISLATHYSMTVARIIGPTNPVTVLATLFLLSYTKLLRTIIATFSFTTLHYPDDHKVPVWAYDGNIRFCEGKHAALFVAGLMAFLFVFLPYTLLLLCGQFIIARSNYRVLSWANKHVCKSFLDAYYAPYKSTYRYWIGLLLVLRFLLFIISAVVDINTPKDPSINLLVLAIMCIGLTIWIWNTGNMYKKWYCNALESSFILNLAILAAASYQVKVEGGNKQAVVYTSVGVAFVTFIIIITYHVIERARDTRVWKHSIKHALLSCKERVWKNHKNEDFIQMDAPPSTQPPKVTTTFIELREPLLESQQ